MDEICKKQQPLNDSYMGGQGFPKGYRPIQQPTGNTGYLHQSISALFITFSADIFIPMVAIYAAAGYRNNNDGSLNNVGSNGNYWSSSPNSSSSNNAGNLNFNSSNVNPLNNNNRANGQSVRCVQASVKGCFL